MRDLRLCDIVQCLSCVWASFESFEDYFRELTSDRLVCENASTLDVHTKPHWKSRNHMATRGKTQYCVFIVFIFGPRATEPPLALPRENTFPSRNPTDSESSQAVCYSRVYRFPLFLCFDVQGASERSIGLYPAPVDVSRMNVAKRVCCWLDPIRFSLCRNGCIVRKEK